MTAGGATPLGEDRVVIRPRGGKTGVGGGVVCTFGFSTVSGESAESSAFFLGGRPRRLGVGASVTTHE